jgi:hypothetical protein
MSGNKARKNLITLLWTFFSPDNQIWRAKVKVLSQSPARALGEDPKTRETCLGGGGLFDRRAE